MIIGITDRNLYENEQIYLEKIGLFLRCKSIDYLVVREKDLDIHQYEELIEKILLDNYAYKSKIIIHTHGEIAIKVGIDKVHLPGNRINTSLINGLQYSYSIHPTDLKGNEIDKLLETAFFILLSPVYQTTCKPECKPLDQVLLQEMKLKYNDQLVLLGGMNKERMEALKSEGFNHFAVRSGMEELLVEKHLMA